MWFRFKIGVAKEGASYPVNEVWIDAKDAEEAKLQLEDTVVKGEKLAISTHPDQIGPDSGAFGLYLGSSKGFPAPL